MTVVDVSVAGEVRPEQVEDARRAILELTRYADGDRIQSARLTVRRSHSRHFLHRPYVADASVLIDGRVLAAHVAGATPEDAAKAAAERLRLQVRRVIDADVALRNEPRVIQRALEAVGVEPEPGPDWEPVPPDEPLPITPVATPADIPVGTLSAVADLIDLDLLFYLFVHVRTEEAVVVHRRDDGRIGLLFPRGSVLADENDIVLPQESWYTAAQPVEEIRDQMDLTHHRFLYFTDAADGVGKVLYRRHEGDYGLVAPD
jgi:sigma 54 modulation/S30EA-like ribosomal protein